MKYLSLAVVGAALVALSGCIAYPVDGYRARGDQGGQQDRDHSQNRNDGGHDGDHHDNDHLHGQN